MPTKKPAPKKAAPAKKAAPKKVAPVKKAAPAKKVAPKKPAPKKAVPVKKIAPKKAAPKKAVPAKKVAPKKAAPVKKVVPKKAAPVKKVVPKKAAPVKKPVPVKAPLKKVVPVKAAPKPIVKPVAKPVEKYVPPAKPVPKIPTPPVKPVRKVAEPIKDIKVPKIGAKSSVPYQPGYVPMERRKEVERSTETLVKYSDAELKEFKDLISKKLDAAKKELVYLQGIITRKDELGGDNDDARYMTMEDGSVSMEREQLGQMASRQITFIDHLEKALMRIENKTYGICRVTGRLIDKARLRAVPHATLSLEAKLGYVKNSSDQ
ncbi:MAG: TraR/DksA C4-type zinc finger protein [Sediminibacterium sp.]|jgi:RNA polymerase-binding transcription factor DksA|nr:TraR/DksA C4-type zinc finger protein [Sediminibacterium sp.]